MNLCNPLATIALTRNIAELRMISSFRTLIAVVPLVLLNPIAAIGAEPDPVEMVMWERSGGHYPRERITLWADGRSEFEVVYSAGTRFIEGKRAPRPNRGWKVAVDRDRMYYIKENPFSEEEAKQKFADALAAGVEHLRAFPATKLDGSGTDVTIRRKGGEKRFLISDFSGWGDQDSNLGSENYRRYIAVAKVFGVIDAEPYKGGQTSFKVPVELKPPDPPEIIGWSVHDTSTGALDAIKLWSDGRSEITVKRRDDSLKPKPGWTVESNGAWSIYTKRNALGEAETKRRFADAVAAGIVWVRRFPIRRGEAATAFTTVSYGSEAQMKHEEIRPDDYEIATKSKRDAENFDRALALARILGSFDTDAYEAPPLER